MAELKYDHFENAAVYVALASSLVVPEQPGVRYSIFHNLFESATDGGSLARRLSAGVRCKYPAYVLALLYLHRLKAVRPAQQISLTPTTFARLVLVAAVVAAKFVDDIYFSNEFYAAELGVALPQFNELEVCFIALLDHRLNVAPRVFHKALQKFDFSRVLYCRQQQCSGLVGRLPVAPELLLALHHNFGAQRRRAALEGWAAALKQPPLEAGGAAFRGEAQLSSSTQSSCSTTDTVAAAQGNRNNCLLLQQLTSPTQQKVLDFLQRRTRRGGLRLLSEAEQLCEIRLHIKAKFLSKLLDQARAELPPQPAAAL